MLRVRGVVLVLPRMAWFVRRECFTLVVAEATDMDKIISVGMLFLAATTAPRRPVFTVVIAEDVGLRPVRGFADEGITRCDKWALLPLLR